MAGQTLNPTCCTKERASIRSYLRPRFSQLQKFWKSKTRCSARINKLLKQCVGLMGPAQIVLPGIVGGSAILIYSDGFDSSKSWSCSLYGFLEGSSIVWKVRNILTSFGERISSYFSANSFNFSITMLS